MTYIDDQYTSAIPSRFGVFCCREVRFEVKVAMHLIFRSEVRLRYIAT